MDATLAGVGAAAAGIGSLLTGWAAMKLARNKGRQEEEEREIARAARGGEPDTGGGSRGVSNGSP